MKIKLYSDLHGEFWHSEHRELFRGDADVVVLAGDIGQLKGGSLERMLKRYAVNYEHVIYTPGNHEFYGSSFQKIKLELPDNVHVLQPGCVKIKDVTFIGATLWTNFRNDIFAEHAARQMISDFSTINQFTPAVAKHEFDRDLAFIKRMYEANEGKKVIVTHFLPAVECISERFRNGSLLNKYFANDLGNWISDLTDVTWMFGHTHDSVDVMIGPTRMLCNPYGYEGHETNHNFKELIIEI